MSKNKSSSYGARFENSKSLVSAVKSYGIYNPTSEDIQSEAYEQYVQSVENQLLPYKNAYGAHLNAMKDNGELFRKMKETAKAVRSEIGEVKGVKSTEYIQVSAVVKLITGQNVSEHSRIKKIITEEIKNRNGAVRDFNSVSQLDQNTRLDNFKSLIALLRSYEFYSPKDIRISISGLDSMQSELSQSLLNVSEKYSAVINERSRIEQLFKGKGGLRDRAKRAKMHVSRIYGSKSPEYRALTNKIY